MRSSLALVAAVFVLALVLYAARGPARVETPAAPPDLASASASEQVVAAARAFYADLVERKFDDAAAGAIGGARAAVLNFAAQQRRELGDDPKLAEVLETTLRARLTSFTVARLTTSADGQEAELDADAVVEMADRANNIRPKLVLRFESDRWWVDHYTVER
ncbi:MAG TPA: hypothetical protein VFF06_26000 [Polyangia bacterium]|nr:hypothetical protein [Polyangia bacterium]